MKLLMDPVPEIEFPKDPFVCPKEGITPIHSYDLGMGLEPEKSYSREGSGFLGIDNIDTVYVCLPKKWKIHHSNQDVGIPDPESWLTETEKGNGT